MGRRWRPRPAPRADELASRTVHEVIRDYPEALAALRGLGVDVAARGGRPLGRLPGDGEAVAAVLARTAWRPDPPATAPAGTAKADASPSASGDP